MRFFDKIHIHKDRIAFYYVEFEEIRKAMLRKCGGSVKKLFMLLAWKLLPPGWVLLSNNGETKGNRCRTMKMMQGGNEFMALRKIWVYVHRIETN